MKNSFVLVFILFFAQACFGQFHQDVLVGEQGNVLLTDLEASYIPTTVLTYKNARLKMFGEFDNINDTVYCVYTNKALYINPNKPINFGDLVNTWGFNTEHTFPQGLGATGNAKSDIHHLYPVQAQVNGDRGSYPFAEIDDNVTDRWYWKSTTQSAIPGANIDEYSEADLTKKFEPREVHKGNVARSMMYFYTMYHAQSDQDFFEGMIPTLCAWHYQDVVDQQEWDRTWAIAGVQGKPNPFVLDCTLPERSYCSGMGFHCEPNATDDAKPIIQLFGAHPNPSHLSVKIRFTLESAFAKGQITVYDMMGRSVALRQIENLVSGPNERDFDVSHWQPGFYFYTVQVDGDLASGKLTVY